MCVCGLGGWMGVLACVGGEGGLGVCVWEGWVGGSLEVCVYLVCLRGGVVLWEVLQQHCVIKFWGALFHYDNIAGCSNMTMTGCAVT